MPFNPYIKRDTNPLNLTKNKNELPRLGYSGLTVIVDNPSRMDTSHLISGFAGQTFDNALAPLVRQQLNIRCADYTAGLLPNTKVVLALGDRAWKSLNLNTNSLNEQRGSPVVKNNIVYIASYFPQDVMDIQNFEARFNTQDEDFGKDEEDNDKGDDEDSEVKRHGATRRNNWRFWLCKDIAKAVRIAKHGLKTYEQIPHILYPPSNTLVEVLLSHKNSQLYFDIETDSERNITCIGFCFSDTPVYTFPCLRFNYVLAYPDIGRIMRAFSLACCRNEVIGHNIVGFDLIVLATKYRILFGRNIYDTMLAQHRCFPEVEKSLGHCISLWTDLPYHKNEGVFMPNNQDQEYQLWSYNAKDVETTMHVRNEIDAYAKNVDGLRESIAQVNSSVRPYLVTTLTGLGYNDEKRQQLLSDNDRRGNQMLRLLRICTGREINPRSPQQVAKYLYGTPPDGLGIARPPKDLTKEVTLRKILTRQECPAINLLLEVRSCKNLVSKFLQFEPWQFKPYEQRQTTTDSIRQNSQPSNHAS